MNKLGLVLFSAILGLAPAQAQPVTGPAPVGPAGAYNASPPTCTASGFCYLQTDVNGNLKVSPIGGALTPSFTSIVQGGNTAGVSIDGNLLVSTPPASQFFDAFSAALDTTTNWTSNNSTGTAATSSGSLVISSSTTASAWGGLSSKQSWAPQGVSLQVYGVWATFTTKTIANSSRVWGMFTVPGSPSITVPVTDGYVWRLDGAGSLFAEIWATGVAVSSTNVTTACGLTNSVPNTYAIYYRTGLTQFYCGAVLAATVGYFSPTVQTLPVSAFSIAGSTPPLSSATMTLGGLTLATYSPAIGSKSAGQTATINDPSGVVQISPNSSPPPVTTTTTNSTISVTNTFQAALAASSTRKSCLLQNTGTHTSYIYFGTLGSATTGNSFQLSPGQSISCATINGLVLTDAVNITGASGDGYVMVSQ